METTKICTKCKVEKEFREFHKHKTAKYGLNLQCKSCKKESYEKLHISDIIDKIIKARIIGFKLRNLS